MALVFYKGIRENEMYKSKYPLTHDESLKGYEANKIKIGIDKELDKQWFWKALPFALLVAFAVLAIFVLGAH
jgi:hypothetical protein